MKNDEKHVHKSDMPLERFRFAYGPRYRTPIAFPANSRFTDQSAAADADINTIMARYQSTGEIPKLNELPGQWLDVTGMDFHEHMNAVTEARELFAQMPSSIRDRFGNDPASFLDFTNNEENLPEMARMGLLTQEATQNYLNPQASNPVDTTD